MSIRAIAFDCFGVIINDSGHNWVDSAGFSPELEERVHDLFRQRDVGTIQDDEYYSTIAKETGVDPGVLRAKEYGARPIDPMLVSYIKNDLAGHYTLYLASNAGASLVNSLMAEFDLSEVFACSFVSSQMGVIKPQEGFYAYMLSAVSVPAGEILFVDDRKPNVDAAIAAGMQGYHYNQGFAKFKEYLEVM